MGLTFDMSITLGNVLQIVAIIVTVSIAFTKLSNRLVALEIKVDAMWADYKRHRVGV